jgi:hypothetical protein
MDGAFRSEKLDSISKIGSGNRHAAERSRKVLKTQ